MSDDESHESTAAIDLARRKRSSTTASRGASTNPVSARRDGALRRLLRHRLARAGGVLFASLAMCAVCADGLASDFPLICRWHGALYLAPCVSHPAVLRETDCALLRATKWRGDWVVSPLVEHGPRRSDPSGARLAPPGTPGHPLGTDAFGRDVFARCVHGLRATLVIGVAATALLFSLGVILGAVAGFAGGIIDAMVARIVEALTAIPSLVLALVVETLVLHPTSATLFWTLALTRWTEVARVVRGEVISTSRLDYVTAARALGASSTRVLVVHVLPNAISCAFVAAVFGVASLVAVEASVDFLLGARAASDASSYWAEMMAEARGQPHAWWLVALPASCLLVTLASFHLVGDAMRIVLDPTSVARGRGAHR